MYTPLFAEQQTLKLIQYGIFMDGTKILFFIKLISQLN